MASDSTGETDNLRSFAYHLYRDPNDWLYLPLENPLLRGYSPDESLPSGLMIPAEMLDWQIYLHKKAFPNREVILRDSLRVFQKQNPEKTDYNKFVISESQ
ncbi:MAG: hypothetical protein KKB31_01895 [Nanoarchaeota archaeon]|nr:hypothetical protein [Nanoarchaeota archaeon]